MKALTRLLPCLLLAWLCGCAHSQPQPQPISFRQATGDCGPFILQHALLYDAKPLTTNGLPKLGGSWSYVDLQNGVLILLPRASYDAIETFVLQAFGKPHSGPGNARETGQLKGFQFTRKGNGIRYALGESNTVVAVTFGSPEVRQPGAWLVVPDDRVWKAMSDRHDPQFR